MTTNKNLTHWNGESGGYKYQNNQNLLKDSMGNIWYNLNGNLKIWCSSQKLTSHLKRLSQIQNRV